MSHVTDLFSISRRQRTFMGLLLALLALAWLLPLFTALQQSFKVDGWVNYVHVWQNPVNGVPFWRYFLNSLLIASGASLIVVTVSSLSGFAFSKIEFAGKELIYSMVVVCLAVSAVIVYIPIFLLLKSLHLYNTHWAVILPQAVFTLPFGVLLMRNYFDGLPSSLMESATIDGAGLWSIYRDIYLPLSRPAMVNLGVLQFMWSLQDFFLPLMFLTEQKLAPATVAINVYKGAFGNSGPDLGRLNAALVMTALPTVLVFVLAEKYIAQGLSAGALKE